MFQLSNETISTISLILSIVATIISAINVVHSQKQFKLSQQQFELNQEQFIEEITREGLILQIERASWLYLAESIDSAHASKLGKYILIGKLRGKQDKNFFVRRAYQLPDALEGKELGIKGNQLILEIAISNSSDLPIWIEDITVTLKFVPIISTFILEIFNLTPTKWALLVYNSYTYSITHKLAESIKYERQSLLGSLYGWSIWNKNPDLFTQFSDDLPKRIGQSLVDDAKIVNLATSKEKPLSKNLQIKPKSKIRLQIMLRINQSAAQFLVDAKENFPLAQAEISIFAEKNKISKTARVHHYYQLENSDFSTDDIDFIPSASR